MIYVYGAGGHGKVVTDLLQCTGKTVAGIFDDDPSKQFWEFPVLTFPGPFNYDTDELVIAIGNNYDRKRIAMDSKIKFMMATHPSTIISRYSTIGEGTIVLAGALINTDTIVGKHCLINSYASVDHDCVLEDYVHISPNATLCGGVVVGECTHIGAAAVVLPYKKIGANSIIGAGTVVISDIPDNVVAVGNPARIIKNI